jgi:uncharacterized membrane protein
MATPEPTPTRDTENHRSPGGPGQSAHQRSKQPRSLVAGPYGHPIHAALVTLPIGAWIASIIFDIIAFTTEDPSTYLIGAQWLIGIGIAGAIIAGIVGAVDLSTLAHRTRARTVALTHMALNLTVIALFLISLVIRLSDGADDVNAVAVIISAVALVLLMASGWLGGELSYRYGVRVADEATQRRAFE